MVRKVLFEPKDVVMSFTGQKGLIISRKDYEQIRVKARRGNKPGHFFAPGCCDSIDYVQHVPVFFEDGTYDIMKSMNVRNLEGDTREERAKLETMLNKYLAEKVVSGPVVCGEV
jgi:hypothetical protein